jgi:hypothetical protein
VENGMKVFGINSLDKAICPGCGTICSSKSIGRFHTCKKCGYEGVYTVRRILNGKTDYPNWNDVNLKLFLESLQNLGLLEIDNE